MRLAHLNTRYVAEHVTLLCNLVVLACVYHVLLLKVQQLYIVPVCLPQVAELGLESKLKLVALQLRIGNLNLRIAHLALAVAVPQVESYGHACAAAPVAAACVTVGFEYFVDRYI